MREHDPHAREEFPLHCNTARWLDDDCEVQGYRGGASEDDSDNTSSAYDDDDFEDDDDDDGDDQEEEGEAKDEENINVEGVLARISSSSATSNLTTTARKIDAFDVHAVDMRTIGKESRGGDGDYPITATAAVAVASTTITVSEQEDSSSSPAARRIKDLLAQKSRSQFRMMMDTFSRSPPAAPLLPPAQQHNDMQQRDGDEGDNACSDAGPQCRASSSSVGCSMTRTAIAVPTPLDGGVVSHGDHADQGNNSGATGSDQVGISSLTMTSPAGSDADHPVSPNHHHDASVDLLSRHYGHNDDDDDEGDGGDVEGGDSNDGSSGGARERNHRRRWDPAQGNSPDRLSAFGMYAGVGAGVPPTHAAGDDGGELRLGLGKFNSHSSSFHRDSGAVDSSMLSIGSSGTDAYL